MTSKDLTDRLAAAQMLDTDLLVEISSAAARVFPTAPANPEGIADASEAVMHVIARCLPGWHVHLTGQAAEPDAHWRCSLRASEAHDDDEVVGAAHGPTIPLTLARALWDVVLKLG